MQNRVHEKSIGELFTDLSREMSLILRKEMELATMEMTAAAKRAVNDIRVAAAGSVLAHAGCLVLLAALVLGLNRLGLEAWLSALIVGVASIVTGYLVLKSGLNDLQRARLYPTQTLDTLKESVRWTTQ
jgi:hypothetical protein